MIQQNTCQPLSLQLPAPGHKTCRYHRHARDRRNQQVVISHGCDGAVLGPLRDKVEHHTRQVKCNREMDQHYMLRMFSQDSRLKIKGMQVSLLLLDHDRAGHFGVNATEVAIGARLSEGVGKLLVSIERLRLEGRLIVADNGMWNIVSIRPTNCCSHWNGDGRR